MIPKPTDLIHYLSGLFSTRFTEDELKDLALALGFDFADLDGDNRKAKASAFADYLWRYDLLFKLADVGPRERNDIKWAEILEPHLIHSEANDLQSEGIGFSDRQQLIITLANYPEFQTPEGRRLILVKSGNENVITTNLKSTSMLVASAMLAQLLDHEGGGKEISALGRFLRYASEDDSMSAVDKKFIKHILAKYKIL